jgi:hypothetical protein
LRLTKTLACDVPRALRELAESFIRHRRIRELAERILKVNQSVAEKGRKR